MREERTASCKMTTDAIFARESCLRAATGLRKEGRKKRLQGPKKNKKYLKGPPFVTLGLNILNYDI